MKKVPIIQATSDRFHVTESERAEDLLERVLHDTKNDTHNTKTTTTTIITTASPASRYSRLWRYCKGLL